jgi:hypothetical protein
MVLSLDNESVNNGECQRDKVEGLSLDKPEVAAPFGVRGKVTHATAGTVSTGSSRS